MKRLTKGVIAVTALLIALVPASTAMAHTQTERDCDSYEEPIYATRTVYEWEEREVCVIRLPITRECIVSHTYWERVSHTEWYDTGRIRTVEHNCRDVSVSHNHCDLSAFRIGNIYPAGHNGVMSTSECNRRKDALTRAWTQSLVPAACVGISPPSYCLTPGVPED